MSPELLQAYFVEACTDDVRAPKPGNVSEASPARGVTAQDFILSAEACAADLCAPGLAVGERIYNAIAARRQAVETNTNLGIVLLCAPLVQCALDFADSSDSAPEASMRERLRTVLATTTIADARAVYKAINLANAGGMGEVASQDLSTEPTVNLRAAMALATERDTIAAEYANDYALIFDTALPYYLALRERWGYNIHSVTGLYLFILGNYPDSLVTRKFGKNKADAVSRVFRTVASEFAGREDPNSMKDELASCDAMLKARGINPGTTADIAVASIFLAKILDKLRVH